MTLGDMTRSIYRAQYHIRVESESEPSGLYQLGLRLISSQFEQLERHL